MATKEEVAGWLGELCALGYSAVKRGNHWEIVNNRSLYTVNAGPLSQEDAEREADKLNITVKYRMMDVCKLVGYV